MFRYYTVLKIIYPGHGHDLNLFYYKAMGRRFVAIRIIPGPTLPEGSKGVTREPSAPLPGITLFYLFLFLNFFEDENDVLYEVKSK